LKDLYYQQHLLHHHLQMPIEVQIQQELQDYLAMDLLGVNFLIHHLHLQQV
jgi:hypothetical protein